MKRLVLLFFLCLLYVVEAQPGRPKVGVVLSGGGAKGVAHVSALRAIEQAGLPIDYICGTSMGSLIGGFYAVGYSVDQLDSMVRSQDWSTLLSDRPAQNEQPFDERQRQNSHFFKRKLTFGNSNTGGGLIEGVNLDRLFTSLTADYLDSIDFNSLPTPFACVATDIVDNTEIVFHNGYLKQAIRASMSIPGVFTPVRMGNRVLVDGALRNNYPADVVRDMGADIVIGVSVQGPLPQSNELNNAFSILWQIIDLNCKNKYDSNIAITDVFIRVDVTGFSSASFTTASVDTLLSRGAEEAASHLNEMIALRQRLGIDSVPPQPHYTPKNAHKHAIPLSTSSAVPTVMVGMRFDTEEMGATLIDVDLPFPMHRPANLELSLRLAKRLRIRGAFNMKLTKHFQPSIGYNFFRNDLDIYVDGERSYNTRHHLHRIDISPLRFQYKYGIMQLTGRWDYYKYQGSILASRDPQFELNDAHYFSYLLNFSHNTENDWYFPSKGSRINANAAYRTTNLIKLNDGIGLLDLSAHYRLNLPLGRHFALQTMFYGRLLLGEEKPLCFSNSIGTEWFDNYVDGQMPFPGVGNIEYVSANFIAMQVQLQYNLMKNHYIQLRAAAARHSNTLTEMINVPNLVGGSLAYFYNTFFGPVGATAGLSSLTNSPYFYITIGHKF